MAVTSIEEMTGKEKAAILLLALGPERSAQIYKHLREEDIEEITIQISNTKMVMPEVKESVLEEFYQVCIAQQYITEGGYNYARQILERALGEEKAAEIVKKLMIAVSKKPFEFALKIDATQIRTNIEGEHPQVIALMLSHLKPQQAAQVFINLPQEKQAEVAKRIAIMDRASPDVVKKLEAELEKRFSKLMLEDYGEIGGIDSLVDILNLVDRSTEKNILDTLDAEDAELAVEIRKKMFVFEDIIKLTGRDVQNVLMSRDGFTDDDLVIAIKGSSEEVKRFIFANMTTRRADIIREELETIGPKLKSAIEDAQQKIVNVIRAKQESGEIYFQRGGGDEVVN